MSEVKSRTASLFSRADAARYLAISVRKLDQLAASGKLPRVKIDACVRFLAADLDAFIEAQKQGGEQ